MIDQSIPLLQAMHRESPAFATNTNSSITNTANAIQFDSIVRNLRKPKKKILSLSLSLSLVTSSTAIQFDFINHY